MDKEALAETIDTAAADAAHTTATAVNALRLRRHLGEVDSELW